MRWLALVAGVALIARIFSPDGDWWMTTGAALPLNDKAIDRIIREMQQHQRRFAPHEGADLTGASAQGRGDRQRPAPFVEAEE